MCIAHTPCLTRRDKYKYSYCELMDSLDKQVPSFFMEHSLLLISRDALGVIVDFLDRDALSILSLMFSCKSLCNSCTFLLSSVYVDKRGRNIWHESVTSSLMSHLSIGAFEMVKFSSEISPVKFAFLSGEILTKSACNNNLAIARLVYQGSVSRTCFSNSFVTALHRTPSMDFLLFMYELSPSRVQSCVEKSPLSFMRSEKAVAIIQWYSEVFPSILATNRHSLLVLLVRVVQQRASNLLEWLYNKKMLPSLEQWTELCSSKLYKMQSCDTDTPQDTYSSLQLGSSCRGQNSLEDYAAPLLSLRTRRGGLRGIKPPSGVALVCQSETVDHGLIAQMFEKCSTDEERDDLAISLLYSKNEELAKSMLSRLKEGFTDKQAEGFYLLPRRIIEYIVHENIPICSLSIHKIATNRDAQLLNYLSRNGYAIPLRAIYTVCNGISYRQLLLYYPTFTKIEGNPLSLEKDIEGKYLKDTLEYGHSFYLCFARRAHITGNKRLLSCILPFLSVEEARDMLKDT